MGSLTLKFVVSITSIISGAILIFALITFSDSSTLTVPSLLAAVINLLLLGYSIFVLFRINRNRIYSKNFIYILIFVLVADIVLAVATLMPCPSLHEASKLHDVYFVYNRRVFNPDPLDLIFNLYLWRTHFLCPSIIPFPT